MLPGRAIGSSGDADLCFGNVLDKVLGESVWSCRFLLEDPETVRECLECRQWVVPVSSQGVVKDLLVYAFFVLGGFREKCSKTYTR